jgi:hypothetical protein
VKKKRKRKSKQTSGGRSFIEGWAGAELLAGGERLPLHKNKKKLLDRPIIWTAEREREIAQ